ncbi:sulfotransferase [Alcanivorax nanhaiticus]|uniref:Sulfotransferase n=1 Tax=Alcanivorax nanhaiticus TaxID=1177154 RepID=A0A095TM06_9GAMM|nr:sulfotransferase [Alcanivorax nanhaiticus]KGD63483.1 sulfotransferase [Alcanivorax nanhaiticus]
MNSGDYPGCFIIGLPKSGTTALYNILTQSPEVFDCAVKEPNHFLPTSVTQAGVHDVDAYLTLYRDAVKEGLLSIDASISYAHFPDSIKKILSAKPDAKFVIVLRRPERMVVSQYQQMRYGLFEDKESFHEAWRDRLENGQPESGYYQFVRDYPKSGAVGSILEKVLKIVPANQIKILIYEEIFSDSSESLANLVDFLGLAPFEYEVKMINAGKEPSSNIIHRLIIKDSLIFRAFRILVKKIPFLNPDSVRGFYEKRMVRASKSSFSDLSDLELDRYFELEKRKVEALLGRSIPSWWG